MAANRVAAINPPIDDTDPIRKFSIDPGSRTDLQNPAEFSPKGKPILLSLEQAEASFSREAVAGLSQAMTAKLKLSQVKLGEQKLAA